MEIYENYTSETVIVKTNNTTFFFPSKGNAIAVKIYQAPRNMVVLSFVAW